VLLIETADGKRLELDIEKDDDEDLGLEFANPVMTDCEGCENHCVFCFIDHCLKACGHRFILKMMICACHF
jgi:NifB/MoaA-like Fe-S oxidoreductase